MLAAEVSLTGPERNTVILKPRGSIDSTTAPELKEMVTRFFEEHRRYVIVDFSSVDYISSAGWGVLLGRLREFREQGGDIYLVAMNAPIRSVFELMGLDAVLRSFDSVKQVADQLGWTTKDVVTSVLGMLEGVERKPAARRPPAIPVETALREIIKENPLWGPHSVAAELIRRQYGVRSVGVFATWRRMVRMGFATTRRRLLYAFREVKKERDEARTGTK